MDSMKRGIGMSTIEKRFNKNGEVIGYRIRVFLGVDEHKKQIRRTITIDRPEGLTPKKEEKEVQSIADAFEREQIEEYEKNRNRIAKLTPSVKSKVTLDDFIDNQWMMKHVKDGKHTPNTIAFYQSMADDIKAYFKNESPGIRLSQIGKEEVLDYLTYMRTTKDTKSGKPYGATTIQHHFSTLRNVLGYAVYLEYIKEDPCRKLKESDRPKREDKMFAEQRTETDEIVAELCYEPIQKKYVIVRYRKDGKKGKKYPSMELIPDDDAESEEVLLDR